MSILVPPITSMLTKFKNHLNDRYPELKSKRLLLAVSGGIDSMVMLDLFSKLDYNIIVAHCNFGLRKADSDLDQELVSHFCAKNNIVCCSKRFETTQYAHINKVSIQIAARELRYKWFYELLEEQQLDYILTAHNLNDSLETFLINFARGTGIDGLIGIKDKNNILRPLIETSRDEIHQYALDNNVRWREDASNATDKYVRNKIRHSILPILQEINPSILNSFLQTSKHLDEIKSFSDENSNQILDKLLVKDNDSISLNINDLKKEKNYNFILYQWLSKYDFTAWQDIYNLIDSQTGKYIETAKYKLLKNRNELILSEKKILDKNEYLLTNQDEITHPIHLKLSEVNHVESINNPNIIYVDKNLLNFPLTLGKWKEGLYFYPFGMQGKRKKVSKFFKDEKFSALDKENTWILYSDNQVVWIVSKRADDRFKVTTNTTSILKIEFLL